MTTADSFPALGAIPVGFGPEGIAVDGRAGGVTWRARGATASPCSTSTRARW